MHSSAPLVHTGCTMVAPLETALTLPAFAGAEVLAGDPATCSVSGLVAIEWPVRKEILPGDLVLTGATECDDASFTPFLLELIASPAAAIYLASRRRVPPAALAAAHDAGMPLLRDTTRVRFADIGTDLYGLILDRRRSSAAERSELADRLLDRVTTGARWGAVIAAIESGAGRPCFVLDRDLRPIETGTLLDEASSAAVDERTSALALEQVTRIASRVKPGAATALQAAEIGIDCVATAVAAREEPVAYLCLAGPWDAAVARTLEDLYHPLAMLAVREQAVAETEERVSGQVIWTALRERAESADVLHRATFVGIETRTAYHVLVGRVAEAGQDPEQLARWWRRSGLHGRGRVFAAAADDQIAALLPEEDHARALALSERIAASTPAIAHCGLSAASAAFPEVHVAYADAESALRVAESLDRPGVADAAALGPFLLLAQLAHDPRALERARRTLEPLMEYDRARRGDLLRTLEVYLAEASAERAAARLYLSRRAVIYRLRRIEALTGLRFQEPEERSALDIAMRILQLAERGEPGRQAA